MFSDLELERDILRCVVYGGDYDGNNSAFVPIATVPVEAFHFPPHQKILREFQRLFESGEIISAIALRNRHDEIGVASSVLSEIWNWGPEAAYVSLRIDQHIRRLMELYARRRINVVGEGIFSADVSLEEVTAKLQEIGEIATATSPIVRARDGKQLGRRAADLLDHDEPGSEPIPTGLPMLDEILDGGMSRGHLIIVKADTGGGKTLAMTNLAARALRDGRVVGYVSQELTEDDMLRRLIGVLSNSVVARRITPHVRALAVPAEIASWGSRFRMESSRLNIAQVAQFARILARENGRLDLLVVDHIQITPADISTDSRQRELAYLSERLSAIPKELGCAVVTGSQVNEAGQTREARDIEHNARVVLRIQWPYLSDRSRARNEVEIEVTKNTMGPTGGIVPCEITAGLTLSEIGESRR